jgi:diacylglycerol kinase family enzyme
VVNTLGWGMELPMAEPIDIDDGLLDVFLINQNVQAAVESLRAGKLSGDIFQHWQGRNIVVECEPDQDVWLDGEPREKTPFKANVAQKALRVVVPLETEA